MAKEKIIGIYKITSPSGKIYIGQATDIKYRWAFYNGLHCKNQNKLYHSLKKYGVENHTFEIIETIEIYDKNELDRLEIYYIKHFDTFQTEHGLNLTEGGGNGKMSEESKLKNSESKKGEKNPMYGKRGKDCHNFGRKHSPEQNKQNSERMKGKKLTPESIEKREETKRKKKEEQIANGTYTPRKLSKEFCLKMSEYRKGKPPVREKGFKVSEETKNKIRETLKKTRELNLANGLIRVVSEEQKKRISETRKRNKEEKILNGTYVKRTLSEETRKKMSEARKGKKQRPEVVAKRVEYNRMIKQERLSMIF